MPVDFRVRDLAREVLEQAEIPQETKAQLWDRYHSARSGTELANQLAKVVAPSRVKRVLVIAKAAQTDPVPEHLVGAITALSKLATIPEPILAMAEKHHRITAALIAAALRDEK